MQIQSENHTVKMSIIDKIVLPHQIPEESVPEQPYREVLPPAKQKDTMN